MFWSKRKRRQTALEKAIEPEDTTRLRASLWQSHRLTTDQQQRLIRWCRIFIQEKHWEGCDGLAISDEIQETIAASAGLMVLSHEDWYFDRTQTILVYPVPYVGRTPTTLTPEGMISSHRRAGETAYRAPVVVNWRDAYRASRTANQLHSVVIHEFAHQLDLINGPQADGLPPLPNHIDAKAWWDELKAEYDLACEVVEAGDEILIDDYGLTDISEFFAVASEAYFQGPEDLAHFHPGVFDLLDAFYQLDLRR